jgi:hypothetical protein
MTNGSRILFKIVGFFIEPRSVPWLHIRTLRGKRPGLGLL